MIRNVKELWRFRTLVWALVCRHLRARYRGSVLGFVWSFLNPLCLIAVYSLVYRYYLPIQTVEHYTLLVFSGLLPWIWFSGALLEATASISSGGNLITKALFPPHVLPVVACLTHLAHYLFALPLLVGFALLSGVPLGLGLVILPAILLAQLLFLLGLGLAFAAINVRYRDVQHVLGNLLTLWFFLSPILYRVTNVPAKFQFTIQLNPLAWFTEMYHSIFYDSALPSPDLLLRSVIVGVLTFALGNLLFNRYREEFAELI